MFSALRKLALTAALGLAGNVAMAAPFAIDGGDSANGLYDLYSATFDGALSPCGGGSPSYCSFFQGDWPTVRNVAVSPNPTGVDTASPVAIGEPHPAGGSFLDIDLTGGNTLAQIVGTSTISLASPLTLTINGTTVVTAAGAGFAILPSAVASINGLGQVEFLVDNAPNLAADFSTLSAAVTSCVGPLCALVGVLSLDMVRYRLFLDFDPTFTSFTGNFIGQANGGTTLFATLNSTSVVPVPAAGYLLGSALGLLGSLARRRFAV